MSELPDPLVGPDVDLQDFAFMPLHVARLRDSDFAASVHPEAAWYAVLLWAASWHQIPAGSLPNNDTMLMRFAGLGRDVKTWKKHRDEALYGFELCKDGRLYHPIIAELVNRAWARHHRLRHAALRKTNCKRIKGSRWSKVRLRILVRDGFKCRKCDSAGPYLEVDHVKPLAEGGGHHDSNLQVLCRRCNRKKSFKIEGVGNG